MLCVKGTATHTLSSFVIFRASAASAPFFTSDCSVATLVGEEK